MTSERVREARADADVAAMPGQNATGTSYQLVTVRAVFAPCEDAPRDPQPARLTLGEP